MPPPKGKTFTKTQLEDAMRQSNGKVALAAGILKCCVKTIYNRMDKWPEIREIMDEVKIRRIDVAETKLEQAVMAGEAWAIKFILENQAQDRGYGRSLKLEGGLDNKSETTIKITLEDVTAQARRVMDEMDRLKALPAPREE